MKTSAWSVRCTGWVLAVSLALGPEALLLAETTTPAEARQVAADLLFPEDTQVFIACPDAAFSRAATDAAVMLLAKFRK